MTLEAEAPIARDPIDSDKATRPASTEAIRDELLDEIEQHLPRLRRYARSLTRDASSADDLVQETLLRAIDKLGSFRVGTNLTAWLFTIMRNTHISSMRKSARVRLQDPSDIHISVPGNQMDNVALKSLSRAIDALPDSQREVVMLVGVEGLSYQDAAVIMNVPVGTVRSRLSRARDRLAVDMYGDQNGARDG